MGEAITDVFKALDEFLVAAAALLSAAAALLGLFNRRELRNGLGVTKLRHNKPLKELRDLKPGEIFERRDEVPLRAAIDATLSFVAGIDDRVERIEKLEQRREERDEAGRAGATDRRVDDNGR